MKKLEITYKDIEELIPYARNSRLHDETQIAQIAASIKEFGWRNPVLIDGENGIIAGHGRLMAARKLGMDKVRVIQLSGMTPTQKKAYIIADNQLALNAGWDTSLLTIDISELKDEGFNLDLLGFDEKELVNIIDPLKENKELKDEIYEPAFSIIIDCDDESEQEKIFNELNEKGYKCRVQSL